MIAALAPLSIDMYLPTFPTIGKEFGTVTSRKRRCGWLDGVLVRQTIKVSVITGIALTKLDVLDELNEIKLCTPVSYTHLTLPTNREV